MKKFLISLSIVYLSFVPLVMQAQIVTGGGGGSEASTECPTTPHSLKDLICMAMDLVNPLVGLLTGLAVLYFMWNVVSFIRKADDEKGRAAAKDGIVYGVIGLFVLFSFWGLVEFLRASVFG